MSDCSDGDITNMKRKSRNILLLSLGVVAVLLFVLLFFVLRGVMRDRGMIQDTGGRTDDESQVSGGGPPPMGDRDIADFFGEEEGVKERAPEDFLRILSVSANRGDPRTPRLREQPPPRLWQPGPAALQDPALYEKGQKEARWKALKNIERAAQRRLEIMERKIEEAELGGNRSSTEINEARDALRELRDMRKHLKKLLKKKDAGTR